MDLGPRLDALLPYVFEKRSFFAECGIGRIWALRRLGCPNTCVDVIYLKDQQDETEDVVACRRRD
jgi:hypothetical protein